MMLYCNFKMFPWEIQLSSKALDFFHIYDLFSNQKDIQKAARSFTQASLFTDACFCFLLSFHLYLQTATRLADGEAWLVEWYQLATLPCSLLVSLEISVGLEVGRMEVPRRLYLKKKKQLTTQNPPLF